MSTTDWISAGFCAALLVACVFMAKSCCDLINEDQQKEAVRYHRLLAQCLSDGKKEYQCERIILRPMVVDR